MNMKRLLLLVAFFATLHASAQQVNPVPDYVFANRFVASLHPFYVSPSFVNTHDEKVAIAFAVDAALEAFKAGDEDMASLRELGLPYAALDQGSNFWFSCNQQLADELLLTWSDFESAVCNFLASIRPPDFPWQ